MEINTFLQHFADIFDDTDASLITAETNFRNLEEWDSMAALSLIAMVDEEYDSKLSGDDIKTSISVNDLFKKVNSKK